LLECGVESPLSTASVISINVNSLETYGLASSRGQWKYVKYFSFLWLPVEAALSVLKLGFFVKTNFQKELRKTSSIATNTASQAFSKCLF
jgi:hypothetical protein